jgi:hypothetical protein
MIMLACRDPSGDGQPLLEVFSLAHGRAFAEPFASFGVPLDLSEVAGVPEVLCLDGDALILHDRYGQARMVVRAEGLRQLNRCYVDGRFAVGSCAEVLDSRMRWVTYLVDLADSLVVGRLTRRVPTAHPVLLGPFVVSVDEHPDEDRRFGLVLHQIVCRPCG